MDEREFDEKTLATLYYFEPDINGGKYNVYTIYDWLTQIYEGTREPSKDEFDSDYKERFRELKRTKSYTKVEELAYFNDKEGKVRFEIDNLLEVLIELRVERYQYFILFLHRRSLQRI